MSRPLATLPFRWRTALDEPQAQWQRRIDVASWNGQTLAEVRAALATLRDSTATLAAGHPPELWLCDAGGGLSEHDPPFGPEELLEWTHDTYGEERLGQRHESRKPKAFILFTFPPASAEGRERVSW